MRYRGLDHVSSDLARGCSDVGIGVRCLPVKVEVMGINSNCREFKERSKAAKAIYSVDFPHSLITILKISDSVMIPANMPSGSTTGNPLTFVERIV